MDFKIDTRTNYTILTPITNVLDVGLADALRQKWDSLPECASSNLIVDFSNVLRAEENAASVLSEIQQDRYSQDLSIVYTNLTADITEHIRQFDEDLLLNIAPTMDEAIDIISMEVLERDLFREESSSFDV